MMIYRGVDRVKGIIRDDEVFRDQRQFGVIIIFGLKEKEEGESYLEREIVGVGEGLNIVV